MRSSSKCSLIYSKIECEKQVNTNHIRNQISKSRIRSTKQIKPAIFIPDIDSIIVPAGPGTSVSSNSAMDKQSLSDTSTDFKEGGRVTWVDWFSKSFYGNF